MMRVFSLCKQHNYFIRYYLSNWIEKQKVFVLYELSHPIKIQHQGKHHILLAGTST